eukprot:1770689-Rhodomonas_salina.2
MLGAAVLGLSSALPYHVRLAGTTGGVCPCASGCCGRGSGGGPVHVLRQGMGSPRPPVHVLKQGMRGPVHVLGQGRGFQLIY